MFPLLPSNHACPEQPGQYEKCSCFYEAMVYLANISNLWYHLLINPTSKRKGVKIEIFVAKATHIVVYKFS